MEIVPHARRVQVYVKVLEGDYDVVFRKPMEALQLDVEGEAAPRPRRPSRRALAAPAAAPLSIEEGDGEAAAAADAEAAAAAAASDSGTNSDASDSDFDLEASFAEALEAMEADHAALLAGAASDITDDVGVDGGGAHAAPAGAGAAGAEMAGVGLPPGVLEPAPPEPHPSDGPDVVNTDTLKRGFWGIFRMTPKQPGSSAGPFGSYQATCPFHAKSKNTACKKTIRIEGPAMADRLQTLRRLMFWCTQAKACKRQRVHLEKPCDLASVPPDPVLLALRCDEHPGPIKTDEELDHEEDCG